MVQWHAYLSQDYGRQAVELLANIFRSHITPQPESTVNKEDSNRNFISRMGR
jgi:hypothetical protein